MSVLYSRKMDQGLNQQSYYDVLEIPRSATQEEIHQAYLRAKTTYSPNSPALYSIFSPEEAEQLLVMIHEAYMVLSNPSRRKHYDDQLVNGASSESAPTLSLVETKPTVEIKRGSPTEPGPDPKSGSGFARTLFSHYAVNSELESEIQNQTVFDGLFLKKIREYKNVTLEQLASHTRIGKNYLTAVEANDFHALPAAVFVRGFINQYARVLNLDPKRVVDSYMKLVKENLG